MTRVEATTEKHPIVIASIEFTLFSKVFPRHALEVMRDLRSTNATVFPWVYPGRGGRKPIDLRTPFLKALKAASIEDFRWHDLRHSTASYLAMNGASLAEIAAVLGHKTLDMVRRYAHLSPQHTADVVARMNEKIFSGK